MKAFQEGDKVTWSWADGKGEGTVKEVYVSDVTRTIDGKEVSRNARPEEPAYLIVQEDGEEVLKSVSEVSSVEIAAHHP